MIINFNKKFGYKKYINLIYNAYDYAINYLKLPCKELEVNIDFVSKNKIKELNNKFRNNDNVTDVLSFPNLLEVGKSDMQLLGDKLTKENFPMDVSGENNYLFLGDLCICRDKVFSQAKEYDNTKSREMVYIAVHGLLHLLGYDHMKEDDKKIMRKTEEKIMKFMNLER